MKIDEEIRQKMIKIDEEKKIKSDLTTKEVTLKKEI